ncbi:hypothetical protein VE02_09832 [Pseudogymnoascus sp. 03VT05]|nr:hypothetical protein VE02_09832 [Pseudogymnoascus sp. 03VT05]
MSQSDSNSNISTGRCDRCNEMSTWSFLREFYSRVENSRQYAARLEEDLRQYFDARIEQERLEHSVTQKALEFEQQNHRDTARLFDLTYEAVSESCELVDGLRAQVAELKGGSAVVTTVPKTKDLLLELQLSRAEVKRLEGAILSQCQICRGAQQSANEGPTQVECRECN